MGWNRKGKFGIHTGRTLRSHPTDRFYYTRGCASSKSRHEFAVVKELKFTNPIGRLSFDKKRVNKLGIKDGELSFDDGPIVYSMNKHKRWLLPDMVKQDVEQIYFERISESEPYSRSKPCKKEKGHVEDVGVTVVERHAAYNIERSHPDCSGITSSLPSSLNSSAHQRKPRKKHAFVGDLKAKSGSENDVELCYEFLSPFPEKCWPSNRQLGSLTLNYRWHGDVRGTKSKNKCKGRRNKWNRHSHLEKDYDNDLSNDYDTELTGGESFNHVNSACYFPLGAYIDDMLKSVCIKKEDLVLNTVNPKKVGTDPKQSRSAPYGKGNAIYVEKEDINVFYAENVRNPTNQPIAPQLTVDKKITISLSSEDITPNNLFEQFGNNYIEDGTSPRKFIIKADLNKSLPSSCKDNEECCLLFEVADLSSSAVEADISVLVLNEDVMAPNLVEHVLTDLFTFSNDGPLTIKAIVDYVTQKIVSKVVLLHDSCCVKKAALGITKVPVELIYNICERKPNVCGIRDAVQSSMKRTDAIEGHLLLNRYVDDNEHAQVCCDICFTEENVQLRTDFTTLLQCSHCFCNDCWTTYIASCIGLGQSSLTCPQFQCKTIVGEPTVWSLTNSKIYGLYTKLKHEMVINMNQQFRHCPAADCTCIAHVDSMSKKESSPALPILCNCGHFWCFGCQKDAHWPASCKEAESFRKKCEGHESLRKTYLLPGRISSVQVKRCPFCSHPIEKSVGCQYMLCRCGNSFCWECLSPWNDHDWDTCGERRKELEDVELAFDFGSTRFNKYSKIAIENVIERSRKKFAGFRRLTKRAKQLSGVNKSISFDLETSASRRVKEYSKNSLGSLLEQILHFKYLAHMVLENSAAILAITATKKMLKSMDKSMSRLDFIVQRFNEVFDQPEILFDKNNIDNVKLLLFQGERLIKNVHACAQARRCNQI